jgi:tetratricopeptide (TPR) repeat protein
LIWDDAYLVGENPFFRSPVFGFEVFRHWLFFDSFSTYYRPVQNWSYMIDYWVWRGNPTGYHLTNILLHGFSGFFLYLLLRRILPGLLEVAGRGAAAGVGVLVALVWTVHPVHNAAVAYISGRADSLASFFALAAWLLALRARSTTSRPFRIAWAVAAAGSGLLALCSKEIALMWAALFAIHLLFFETRVKWRRKLAPLGVAITVCGIYALLHALPERRQPQEGGSSAPIEQRGLLMLRALGDYSGLILFPGKLYMERTLTDPTVLRSARAWRDHLRADHLSALGLLALIGAIMVCRVDGAGQRLRRFGACWFVAAFLPISNLFPLNAEVAEHWIYLASIGFLLFLAGCVVALPPARHGAAVGVVVAAIAALGVRTAVRAGDWVNAESFCQRTVASGGASPRVLMTLADIYAKRQQLDMQQSLLRRMLERFPEYAPARVQLGACLQRQGRGGEAAAVLEVDPDRAESDARRYPRTWPAALHRARLRVAAGRADEAREIIHAARARFPEPWALAEYEARLLVEDWGPTAALGIVEEYAAARWWHLEAWQMLGELRVEAGAPELALAAFRHAARLDLYDPRPLKAIARVELERGRGDAAIEMQCAAIRRQPQQGDGYFALAAILEHLGRRSEADAAIRTARGLSARM